MGRKIVYKRGDDLYIYGSAVGFVRIINEKTGEAEDTTNPHIIKKVLDKGVEVTAVNYIKQTEVKI